MRTAALSGLLVSCAYLILHLPRLISNADFIYMCASAAMLFDGKLPASPYFPPGYPALLWLLMHAGLSGLTAGGVLSVIGLGLVAGAVTYVARLWQMPAAPALLLGLLTASLPSLLIVGLNPHLDSLYAGLAAVLLACAMRAFSKPPSGWVYCTALLCASVLVSLRYHAALVVLPLALVLAFSRAKGARMFGFTLLLVSALAIAGTLYALQLATGSIHTAGMDQVRTGAAYRELGNEAEISRVVFDDYAGWLQNYKPVDATMVIDGIIADWPQYLTRKAILGGVALWLLGLLIRRRQPAGAHWLLLFILGYTLAISPAYYITRASALPEVAGMLLACAGLSALFFMPQPKKSRGKKQQFALDPAVAGAVVFLLALAGIGYNGWRLYPILPDQLARAQLLRTVNRQALAVVGGDRRQLYGSIHSTGIYGTGPFCLPAPTWSRLWMDDPVVAKQLDNYLPKYDLYSVYRGKRGVTAVLIWKNDGSELSKGTEYTMAHTLDWEEVTLEGAAAEHARLWRRRMAK